MSLKQKALSGVIWTFTQQFGTQIISFVVSVILARLLLPSDFGTIAVFSVFLGIGNVLIDSGLTNSLIRTQSIDDSDLSTVFYFNLLVSILVYFIIALSAPLIAVFFNIPVLTSIIRVYAIILPIGSFSAIQRTLLTKQMDFKTQFKIQIPSLIIGGLTGIIFALSDYGVWSLVYMSITQSALSAFQYWFYSKWRPKKTFNKSKFRIHFNFGYKLALSSLINIIFQNIYTIVIGKVFSATQLGFYNKADSLQQLPVKSITQPLTRVTYPLFSEIQNDNIRLKNTYQRLMRTVIFITAPLLTIMAVFAEPMFRFIFTEKWVPAAPYFQILCLAGILLPIHSYNLDILKVKGRSDLFLRLEIIKKIIIVISVFVTFKFGIIALLWGKVATSVISLIINCHYSGKFLNYNILKQLRDILPSILLSAVVSSFIFVLDVHYLAHFPDILRLILGGTVAFSSYILLAYIFKFKEIGYLKGIIPKKK